MTSRDYFTALYDRTDDPWHLATSDYERSKFIATVAALPRHRYASAFEPGCSIGVLTRLLAPRCDRLLAMDLDPRPLQQLALPDVTARVGRVPEDWPEETFDLVVLSELLYFLPQNERAEVSAAVLRTLAPGGHLVATHWRHPFKQADADGDDVHAELAAVSGLTPVSQRVEPDYNLAVFRRG